MGHNSVVSGYPKSTGIPRVDGLSTGRSGFGVSHYLSTNQGELVFIKERKISP